MGASIGMVARPQLPRPCADAAALSRRRRGGPTGLGAASPAPARARVWPRRGSMLPRRGCRRGQAWARSPDQAHAYISVDFVFDSQWITHDSAGRMKSKCSAIVPHGGIAIHDPYVSSSFPLLPLSRFSDLASNADNVLESNRNEI